jgi:hypothetical protein
VPFFLAGVIRFGGPCCTGLASLQRCSVAATPAALRCSAGNACKDCNDLPRSPSSASLATKSLAALNPGVYPRFAFVSRSRKIGERQGGSGGLAARF